ncbi:hypothetical protein BH10ACI1_BH10ACI1_10900 [soil metagenome]
MNRVDKIHCNNLASQPVSVEVLNLPNQRLHKILQGQFFSGAVVNRRIIGKDQAQFI